jgi:hypothetical protein
MTLPTNNTVCITVTPYMQATRNTPVLLCNLNFLAFSVWFVLFSLWRDNLRRFRERARTEHSPHSFIITFDVFLHS